MTVVVLFSLLFLGLQAEAEARSAVPIEGAKFSVSVSLKDNLNHWSVKMWLSSSIGEDPSGICQSCRRWVCSSWKIIGKRFLWCPCPHRRYQLYWIKVPGHEIGRSQNKETWPLFLNAYSVYSSSQALPLPFMVYGKFWERWPMSRTPRSGQRQLSSDMTGRWSRPRAPLHHRPGRAGMIL